MAKFTPKTPEILNKIRLPDLDFVDVYNQPPSTDEFVDLEADDTFDAVSEGKHTHTHAHTYTTEINPSSGLVHTPTSNSSVRDEQPTYVHTTFGKTVAYT